MNTVDLYVGGQGTYINGELLTLGGLRCFSAVGNPRTCHAPRLAGDVAALLDSGAFSDKPDRRLSFADALSRQLKWEADAARLWDAPEWQMHAVASYDYLLIDEVWENGARHKKRWLDGMGWEAVEVSVCAAEYITSRRDSLAPRCLVLGCQGVTTEQYIACAAELLKLAHPDDWFGFGGRCILGRRKSLLNQHYITALAVVPMIARAGLHHAHIYGVLYEPALAPLAYLCNQHGITLSTDSSAPVLSATRPDPKKAGMRAATWRGNVEWWRDHLANLRDSQWYRNPAELIKPEQMNLFRERE